MKNENNKSLAIARYETASGRPYYCCTCVRPKMAVPLLDCSLICSGLNVSCLFYVYVRSAFQKKASSRGTIAGTLRLLFNRSRLQESEYNGNGAKPRKLSGNQRNSLWQFIIYRLALQKSPEPGFARPEGEVDVQGVAEALDGVLETLSGHSGLGDVGDLVGLDWIGLFVTVPCERFAGTFMR